MCICASVRSKSFQSIRRPHNPTCRAQRHGPVKKVLFVCGGTGGHVYPAIAIAEQVLELANREQVDVQFMGVSERDSKPVTSRGLSWIQGNAVKMRRPYLSVRNMAALHRWVVSTLTDGWIATVVMQGDMLWDPIVGGSLGSVEVSEAVQESAPDLLRRFSNLEIHAQVRGPSKRDKGNRERHKPSHSSTSMDTHHRFRTTQYFNDMAQQMAASDIVLARAGAGTCAELLQTTVPSVLWPLASATDNHQLHNAEWMEDLGVSLIFRPDTGSSSAMHLARVLRSLIHDVDKRELMQESAKRTLIGSHASAKIARVLLDT